LFRLLVALNKGEQKEEGNGGKAGEKGAGKEEAGGGGAKGLDSSDDESGTGDDNEGLDETRQRRCIMAAIKIEKREDDKVKEKGDEDGSIDTKVVSGKQRVPCK
jgi:hypothetical protein